MFDWQKKASALARRAENRTGEGQLTDAVGEGLAAVAYAALGRVSRQGPRVWLETRAPFGALVPHADILSARVRKEPQEESLGFVLEVFVPGLATAEQWLTVATGTTEWFELNAAEQLVTLLETVARDESEELPAVCVSVYGEDEDKRSLSWDRSY
ncbi:hypothetical protein OHA84_15880 [Streptomyces sp. NBC_00513]|uniref:hypothetical protein n=1 Tax=unclassified Streptomyces TaxID=2593676 RepID=UPI0022534155|nr:hypothetical protein [Streptomyces sp. NBC_00424]MCX5074982.1 hypothetical protein [Streptomyces sp. NBC_00424]WUD41863.1 hypothetical protein OHA84_15880 [Streptomyces sp. NBC_00513]